MLDLEIMFVFLKNPGHFNCNTIYFQQVINLVTGNINKTKLQAVTLSQRTVHRKMIHNVST